MQQLTIEISFIKLILAQHVIKYHSVKTYGACRQLHACVMSGVSEVKSQFHIIIALLPRVRVFSTHWIRGWVVSTTSLEPRVWTCHITFHWQFI